MDETSDFVLYPYYINQNRKHKSNNALFYIGCFHQRQHSHALSAYLWFIRLLQQQSATPHSSGTVFR